MEGLARLISARDHGFWQGKKVLVTGHTGFKGSWLSLWLMRLGAEVSGIALDPSGPRNLFEDLGLADGLVHDFRGDISDERLIRQLVAQIEPEVVFHLAAQAIVSEGYARPFQTIKTNVLGTVCVLEALKETGFAGVVVVATTDKVYANKEWLYPYREIDRLGGKDPYSASKSATEMLIYSYQESFFRGANASLSAARAGNVIGGGDWAPNRLIPDLIRSWSKGETASVRSPESLRPWQHVLEPLDGYMELARQMAIFPEISGAYNFGPISGDFLAVTDVVSLAASSWVGQASWRENEAGRFAEQAQLSIDSSKAYRVLGIKPRWDSHAAIERTVRWYQSYIEGNSALELCVSDIEEFSAPELGSR